MLFSNWENGIHQNSVLFCTDLKIRIKFNFLSWLLYKVHVFTTSPKASTIEVPPLTKLIDGKD
jgi:hypothetical protein